MKKIIYTAILSGLFAIPAGAQQLPLFSQYYYNPFIYNPGFTGTADQSGAYLIHRSQWKDIPGSPVTYALTVDGPVKEKQIGLGLSMFSDQTSMISRNGLYSSYSYRIKINEEHHIVPGISLGVIDNKIDFSQAVVQDANDPFLYSTNRRKVTMDANFGFVYMWKELKVGFAVPQILGNKINFTEGNTNVSMLLTRHFIASAQYSVVISDAQDINFHPNILVRAAKGTPFQLDVNAMFDWKDMVRAGLSYRHGYAIGLNAGVKLNGNLVAGYCYDLSISSVKSYTGGGHELMLGYVFGGRKDDGKIKDLERKLDQAQNATDSTSNLLRKKDMEHTDEINKLKKELEEVKTKTDSLGKVPVKTETGEKPNKDIRSENASDYTDENGQPIKPGYYVVVESFKSKANAARNKAEYQNTKNTPVITIYSKQRMFYYNSILYTLDEESAMDILDQVKKEKPDSWVFKLMEQ